MKFCFLVKSVQDKTHVENPEEVNTIRQATSIRQSAEWDMRMFLGSFPHMKDRFGYEERGERKIPVLLKILLFNLLTKVVWLNQIQTIFMPFLFTERQCFIRERFLFSSSSSFSNNCGSSLVHTAQTYSPSSSPSCADDGDSHLSVLLLAFADLLLAAVDLGTSSHS